MKILIAPQAFKGWIGPREVARLIARGIREVRPEAELIELPIADGGDGLLEALSPPRTATLQVTGPLGEPVRAELGWLNEKTAIFESAAACGLRLVARPDPMAATTRGVGEMIVAAQKAGATRIIVGLGGSATVDGGTGLARALGFEIFDGLGEPLPEGGGSLLSLAEVRPPPPLTARVTALTDVSTPLTGPRGAAPVFAPQKGARPPQVEILSAGLEVLAQWGDGHGFSGIERLPGGGAAGGLGAGLVMFAGAELRPGIDWVLDHLAFEQHLAGADVLITAEGRFDATSLEGKGTGEVLRRARDAGVRGIVVAAQSESESEDIFVPKQHPLDRDGLLSLTKRAAGTL